MPEFWILGSFADNEKDVMTGIGGALMLPSTTSSIFLLLYGLSSALVLYLGLPL
jgi:hypothetical protein